MEDLKEVIVENGMEYRLEEDGCYYPVISLEQETDFGIVKYGMMYAEYIMKHNRKQYLEMVMDGVWNQCLHEVDEDELQEIVDIVGRKRYITS